MKYAITMEARGGQLDEILGRLESAREEIYRCYHELLDLGVLVVKEEPPQADGSQEVI